MAKRVVLGLTEELTVISQADGVENVSLRGRIDTGATLSSIDIELAHELGLGPVVRDKIVKQAAGKSRRHVVMVTLIIKGKKITEEVSIADRKRMKYPLLVGQNMLKKGNFMVDPLID